MTKYLFSMIILFSIINAYSAQNNNTNREEQTKKIFYLLNDKTYYQSPKLPFELNPKLKKKHENMYTLKINNVGEKFSFKDLETDFLYDSNTSEYRHSQSVSIVLNEIKQCLLDTLEVLQHLNNYLTDSTEINELFSNNKKLLTESLSSLENTSELLQQFVKYIDHNNNNKLQFELNSNLKNINIDNI